MTRYLLSIGSNCPDARARLEDACRWLGETFSDVTASEIYTSAALNGAKADYHNMVARVSSPLSVTEMTEMTKGYEAACGRTPLSKVRGQIEMDIDIVATDSTILRPDEYTRAYFMHGLGLLPSDK